MRPAVLLLVFAVCGAPSPERRPVVPAETAAVDALAETDAVNALAETAAYRARRGYFRESTELYRRLAALSPTSASLCAWQIGVVRNTLSEGDKREEVEEIKRLAAVDRTFAAGAAPAGRKLACHRELHDTLLELVFHWNRELTMGCTAYSWQKWPLLEVLFHELLADFPNDPRAPEARRQLERLLRLERGESRSDIDSGRNR